MLPDAANRHGDSVNVYVTTHLSDFLPWQRAAVERFCPGSTLHVVATANASPDVIAQAAMHLPLATTPALVPEVLRQAAAGPGMVIEWDVVPVAPVSVENAVAWADGYGIYPSVVKWTDSTVLNADDVPAKCAPFTTDDFRIMPQQYMAGGCGAGVHFQTIGTEFLHYHYHAAFRTPSGFDEQRKSCWLELMADIQPAVAMTAAGPGSQLKRLLAGFGITVTPDCPCADHARQMDAWGPDECERRTDEIVGWLREEAERRGLPFLDIAGRMLVARAIAAARAAG